MNNKEGHITIEIAKDFLDHISIYRLDLQEEISSLIYMMVKRKLNNNKKEVNRNATV